MHADYTPPAIVSPLNYTDADMRAWLSERYEPTPADLAELDLAVALQHPAVRRLLIAAREVVETNGTHGIYALAYSLVSFVSFPNDSFQDPDAEVPAPKLEDPPPF